MSTCLQCVPCSPHQLFDRLAISPVPLFPLPLGALHPFIHECSSCCNAALHNMKTIYPAAALFTA